MTRLLASQTMARRVAVYITLLLTCFIEIAPSAFADETPTGELIVVVSDLEGDKGAVMLALLDSLEMFDAGDAAFRQASVPVQDGKATVVIGDLPFGTYAIKVYHDENENSKLDTNFVGFPTEPFGFSNDSMGQFGPPSFDEAKFEFSERRMEIEIHAQ